MEETMDVGMMMVFAAYGWDGIDDATVWDEELRLARLAADLGFDALWSAEHHFFDYSFCPDNLQLMSYLAGVTSHADLGTAAVILPWHDPLRVAEQVAMLDHMSNGRLILGLGRGLGRVRIINRKDHRDSVFGRPHGKIQILDIDEMGLAKSIGGKHRPTRSKSCVAT